MVRRTSFPFFFFFLQFGAFLFHSIRDLLGAHVPLSRVTMDYSIDYRNKLVLAPMVRTVRSARDAKHSANFFGTQKLTLLWLILALGYACVPSFGALLRCGYLV